MSKIVCNIGDSSCSPSSNPTVTGTYTRCNIGDSSCVASTPTEGGGAAAPTYNLSGPSSINESESGVFTIATTGVDEGLLIPYTLTGVTSADVVGGSLTGTFEIDSAGAASVTITMVEDYVAEGETMVMTIGSASNPLDFINVSVVDPTYSLSSTGTMIEGNSLNFDLTSTGISDGQTRNWDITGSGHTLSATSGTLTINSNTASVSISSTYSDVFQGTSNFTFRVFGSDGVTVQDTIAFTVTDAASTYAQSSASAFDEGTSLAVTVATTNVADATTLYWTVNHGTTASADFSASSGSFTVTSNAGSFNVAAVADATTEGAETFTIELRTGSTSGTIVNTSSTITINDTSLTPTGVPNSKAATSTGVSTAVSYVSLNNDENITDILSSDWSVTFWIKSDTDLSSSTITNGSFTHDLQVINGGYDSQNFPAGMLAFFRGTDFNIYYSRDEGTSTNLANYWFFGYSNAHTGLFDGDWHHVAIIHNGSGTASTTAATFKANTTIYWDAVAQTPGTEVSAGTDSYTASQVSKLNVGKQPIMDIQVNNPTYDSLFRDEIDEIAFWNGHDLTSAEVTDIYNSGAPTDLENTTGVTVPTEWYRFETSDLGKNTIDISEKHYQGPGTAGAAATSGNLPSIGVYGNTTISLFNTDTGSPSATYRTTNDVSYSFYVTIPSTITGELTVLAEAVESTYKSIAIVLRNGGSNVPYMQVWESDGSTRNFKQKSLMNYAGKRVQCIITFGGSTASTMGTAGADLYINDGSAESWTTSIVNNTVSSSGTVQKTYIAGGKVVSGSFEDNTGMNSDAAIDELCVFNGTLTSADRTAIYNNGVAFDVTSATLSSGVTVQRYFKMGDSTDSESTLNDHSGLGDGFTFAKNGSVSATKLVDRTSLNKVTSLQAVTLTSGDTIYIP